MGQSFPAPYGPIPKLNPSQLSSLHTRRLSSLHTRRGQAPHPPPLLPPYSARRAPPPPPLLPPHSPLLSAAVAPFAVATSSSSSFSPPLQACGAAEVGGVLRSASGRRRPWRGGVWMAKVAHVRLRLPRRRRSSSSSRLPACHLGSLKARPGPTQPIVPWVVPGPRQRRIVPAHRHNSTTCEAQEVFLARCLH